MQAEEKPRGALTGETGEKIKKPPPLPKKLKAAVRVSVSHGGTVYRYDIESDDDEAPITYFSLQTPTTARVTGSPQGWLAKEGPGGAGWVSTPEYAVKKNGKVKGFEVTGNFSAQETKYFMTGGGKFLSGTVMGPGN